jgi:hypothetical protein
MSYGIFPWLLIGFVFGCLVSWVIMEEVFHH